MKALRNLIALSAVAGLATFFAGCGGDDSSNDNNNNNNTGPQFAPATAQAFAGGTYNVQLQNGQTATLAFPTTTTYTFTPQGGAAETGQITGLNLQGEDWVGTLAPADANGTARAGELRLHFTAKNGNNSTGTITYQTANGPVTVPFSATAATGGTTAGGTTTGGTTTGGTTTGGTTTGGTTTGGTTTGGTTTGGTGQLPASLQGHTIQFTSNGHGQLFAFDTANAGRYEDNTAITYSYNATTGQVHIEGGQSVGINDFVLTPQGNTFTQAYRATAQDTPQNFTGTYTLQ